MTPRATGHNPAAKATADPLEEPPEILEGSYGFLAALKQLPNGCYISLQWIKLTYQR